MPTHYSPTGYAHKVRKVPEVWLKASSEVGKLVNGWSRRKDLSVYIAPDGGEVNGKSIAPAMFSPLKYEIELNSDTAFGEHVLPQHIGDLGERATHFEYPRAIGLLLHEAMHAQYSTMDMCMSHKVLEPAANEWFTLLDEPRIEGLGVHQYPENREFLRSSALDIVLKDLKQTVEKMTRVTAAVSLAVLGWARVDAGVLDKADIKLLRPKIIEIVGVDLIKKLRKLWREFLTLKAPVDLPRMFEIAREFAELVKEKQDEDGESDGSGQPGEGEVTLGDLLDALAGDKVKTEFDAQGALHRVKAEEKARAKEKEQREEAADQNKNKQQSRVTFDDSHGPLGTKSASRLVSTRPPTGAERAVANKVSRAMLKAKYRDRVISLKNRADPPGRLNVSGAMQNTAVRRQGGTANAQPWRDKVRHHVDDPNLTVGIMCDISSSMTAAMEPISVSAWVMSAAVQRIQGRAAAVYFGRDVFSVLKPGEFLKEVSVYSASDGVEDFDKGFRALDGGLNLLHGVGARLLVVCSDAQYGGDGQLEACRKWLRACRAAGVAVVWLDYKNGYGRIGALCAEFGAQHVIVGESVTAAADAIGQACTDALNRASR